MNALSRPLLVTSAVLFGMTVLHDLDHVRQGRPLPTVLTVVGFIGLLGAGLCVFLALRRNPVAAPAAALIGLGSVAGLIAVHLLPSWSILSDPYHEANVDALSWTNLALLILAALAVGAAGLQAARSRKPPGGESA